MRVYFTYMCAGWSCTPETLAALYALIDAGLPFDLTDYPDMRELRRAPAGTRPLVGRMAR